MSSGDEQRGAFPGFEFFSALSKIASKATADIQQINHDISQPSATNDLQDGTFWTDLHKQCNTAYNESISLQDTLSHDRSVTESIEAFHTMFQWIRTETARVERQMQQFGYQPPDNLQCDYTLPLTPEQQEIYDQNQQMQQIQIKKSNNEMETDHEDRPKQQPLKSNGVNAQCPSTTMDIDGVSPSNPSTSINHPDEDDIDLKMNQSKKELNTKNQTRPKLIRSDNKPFKPSNMAKTATIATASGSIKISPKTVITKDTDITTKTTVTTAPDTTSVNVTPSLPMKAKKAPKLIPSTPQTPALSRDFLSFLPRKLKGKENVDSNNSMVSPFKRNSIEVKAKTKPNQASFQSVGSSAMVSPVTSGLNGKQPNPSESHCTTSSISTAEVTPSMSGGLMSNPLATPVFSPKFNIQEMRRKFGMAQADKATPTSDGDVTLGSIPDMRGSNINHMVSPIMGTNGLRPITPYNGGTAMQSVNGTKTNTATKAPITVSSFTMRGREEEQQRMNIDSGDSEDDGEGGNEDDKYGMSYLTEEELKGVPQWISNQFGSVAQINRTIDLVNNAMKSHNGRMTKKQIKELVENETPLILLLTRTARLQPDWCQNATVYCLK